ncbi:DUF3160 domain-containing protein [Patescibacteria group bacterium]|nr:DUF3160 domain-containing protein [Patescibacteria group bacterium]
MDSQQNSNPTPKNPKPEIKRSISVYLIFGVVLLLLAIVAIWYFVFSKIQVPDQPVNTNQNINQMENKVWSFGLIKTAFAQDTYSNALVKAMIPFSKISFAQLQNGGDFQGVSFSDSQKAALENDGFFLAVNDIVGQTPALNDFVDMYDKFDGSSNMYLREPDDAIFISSDLALHLYHILIDRSFQSIEQNKFQPSLQAMTKALFIDSISHYNQETNPELKDSYKRLSVYYLIPLVVLDAGSSSFSAQLKPEDFETFTQYLEAVDNQQVANSEQDLAFSLNSRQYAGQNLDNEIYDLANQELILIQNAKGLAPSPLFSPLRPEFTNDYSQFKPRSHYTKNDVLKSYFIAMMWYGRMGFPLMSEPLTRDAILITGQINNLKVSDQSLAKMWSDMSDVIDFFVGDVDDLTAYQYTDEIKKVYGANVSTAQLFDQAKLAEFITQAKKDLPAPRIVSEVLDVNDDGGQREEMLNNLKQFRFMGQRFTPDAYIINNLTQGVGVPDPETGQMLPTMPTTLMPLRVLAPDNQVVSSYLNDWINDPVRIKEQNRESDKIIAKVLGRLDMEFAAYDQDMWRKNIYWRWLDIFSSLLGAYGEGYPYFMQTGSWQKKNIGTTLGSYTELKHDTLLYAKQSYAELGGGGDVPKDVPEVVKGYVEADLEFWNKIVDLATVTMNGLKDREVFPEEYEYKYQSFIDSAIFFRQLAEKELSNQTISDDDFEKLRTISTSLSRIVEPLPGGELTDKEKRAGIIADIHTDAVNEQILYQATGKPYIVYVAVSDTNGTRLTRGVVYSHYEFADTLDERLSDEDWQDIAYKSNGTMPQQDKWSSELIK